MPRGYLNLKIEKSPLKSLTTKQGIMCKIISWKMAPRDIKFSSGSRTQRQYKAGVILINDENNILLVQNYDGKWTFPKGGIECGETIEEAAVRELFEETGIRLPKKDMKIFIKSYKQTYFICRARAEIKYDETLIQDKVEITGIGWFCMEHLEEFNMSKPTLRIIGLLKRDMSDLGMFLNHFIR